MGEAGGQAGGRADLHLAGAELGPRADVALESPGVAASSETGKAACTVLTCPGSSVTGRAPPALQRDHDRAPRLVQVHRHHAVPTRLPVSAGLVVCTAVPRCLAWPLPALFAAGRYGGGLAG